MRNFMNKIFVTTSHKLNTFTVRLGRTLNNNSGEGFVDTAVKILISVVIGGLLLAGLYLLFKDTVLPTLTEKITEMFNFKG
jgi:hypothetical protein